MALTCLRAAWPRILSLRAWTPRIKHFGRSDTYTYDKLITGTGSVATVGSGTTTLTASNSYSGGTILRRGTLSISEDENLGDVAGGLMFNGGMLRVTGKAMTSTTRAINMGAAGGGLDIVDVANTLLWLSLCRAADA